MLRCRELYQKILEAGSCDALTAAELRQAHKDQQFFRKYFQGAYGRPDGTLDDMRAFAEMVLPPIGPLVVVAF